jgi:peptidoglycan hydrolase CwlO-like protein
MAAIIALTVALGLLGSGSESAWGRRSVESLRSRRSSTYQKITNVRKNLRAIKHKQALITGELDAADRRLEGAVDRRNDAAAQLKTTQAELRRTKAAIEKTERRLAEHEAALGERLRAVQKKGPATYLGVILDATDFSDLANRAYLCEKIVQADTDLLVTIQRTKRTLDIQRADLEKREQARRRLLARIQAEEEQIRQAKAAKLRTLKDVMADRVALERRWTSWRRSPGHWSRRSSDSPPSARAIGIVGDGRAAWGIPPLGRGSRQASATACTRSWAR